MADEQRSTGLRRVECASRDGAIYIACHDEPVIYQNLETLGWKPVPDGWLCDECVTQVMENIVFASEECERTKEIVRMLLNMRADLLMACTWRRSASSETAATLDRFRSALSAALRGLQDLYNLSFLLADEVKE